MLAASIIAVLGALRNDPNKQLLIYGSDYPSNGDVDLCHYISSIMSAQHPENYLQFNQRKLLEIVEQFYDRILKVAVNEKQVSNETNYRDIKLNEHDQIAIVYGKPPTIMPTKYEFSKGL